MIFGCVIYLTYSLHGKTITEIISGQCHGMRLIVKVRCEQNLKIRNEKAHSKCFEVYIIISH